MVWHFFIYDTREIQTCKRLSFNNWRDACKRSTGNTITTDYINAFNNGWQGVMPWTSNGVDINGDLSNMGEATKHIKENFNSLVNPW